MRHSTNYVKMLDTPGKMGTVHAQDGDESAQQGG